MENIPTKIIDYATRLGYTGQSFVMKSNGISYYRLFKKNKNNIKARKIGFPLIVRIKGGDVVEATFEETKMAITYLCSKS